MSVFKNPLRSLGIVSFLTMASTTALGSADVWYTPDYKSLASSFVMRDVSGMLVPSNDTRDNLIFLIADRRKQQLTALPSNDGADEEATYGTYGEGSVCVSDTNGRAGFIKAVTDDTSVPANEKQLLQAARETLACKDGEITAGALETLVAVQSGAGRAFVAYLKAIDRFYRVDHSDDAAFVPLADTSQPWVREASRYMLARVRLLASQANAFDDWGVPDRSRVNQVTLTAAKDSLKGYLAEYPQGAYAKSATGLIRRAHWIGGDASGQAAVYSKALLDSDVSAATLAMAREFDQKLGDEGYFSAAADPVIVAVQLFRLMRPKTDSEGKVLPGMTTAELEAFRARFAGQENLFNYLQAVRAWFVDGDADSVLKLIPAQAPVADVSYLEFSRQILRAQALAKSGDATARDTLLALFPFSRQLYQNSSLQLELAKYDERHKNISAVFEKDTLIKDPDIRKRALDYVAGPIILRQQATVAGATVEERHTALFRLLVRDLKHGRFKGFVDDIKLLPPVEESTDSDGNDKFSDFRSMKNETGYNCPDLTTVAAKLAKNPKDVNGRLCLGDFFRGRNYTLDLNPVEKDELGGTGTVFAGKVLARQDFYTDIMNNAKASREDRAYALYRAIHCYAPVGINDCGGTDVDRPQRKKWFQELKARYGDTSWGKQQDVYW